MKVGLVTPYDFAHAGGVREHISCLDRLLQDMGHDVRILAPSTAGRDGYGSNVIVVSGAVVPVPISGSVARISLSPAVYRRVRSILRDEDFDVVHIHEPLTPILPLAVLRHSRAVNVGTFHAYRESNAGYQVVKPFLDPFFGRLDGRIAVSPAARELIASYFPGRYTIIPNGIEFERFAGDHVRPFEQYDDGRLNILFVGRLEERKGFEYLIRAFKQIRIAVPSVRMLVVGAYDKDDKADYVRYARKHGLHEIRFVGYVSAADIPRYYRTADVFCAPSTGFESFGIVLLEAMAAGTPIVASDIMGYRDVMTHEREGLLVTPADADDIAAALIRLLRDERERRRMGEEGRATASRYDWSRVARLIEDFYVELLESRRSGTEAHAKEERSYRELVSRVSSWLDPR
ncbi:MAG: glycosyltransferase family 4 protein [Anaerolineae bacterium]